MEMIHSRSVIDIRVTDARGLVSGWLQSSERSRGGSGLELALPGGSANEHHQSASLPCVRRAAGGRRGRRLRRR